MAFKIKKQLAQATAAQISDVPGNTSRKSDRILEFAARFAQGIDPKLKSSDHGRILYGKDGLPRN